MTRSQLRIGEIARLLGITPKTVRHYHKLGLLPEPERSEGGYRLYGVDELQQLGRIRRLSGIGLSLQQIKFILDADDPDSLLRETLHRLSRELAAQQERIEARRRRIESYLAEGRSLAEVTQPEAPSPTYQMLSARLGGYLTIPETLAEFDKHLFSQLDSFDWGEAYAEGWQTAAGAFETQTEVRAVVLSLSEKLIALQSMSEDDPQIQVWADEVVKSKVYELMAALFNAPSPMSTLESPVADAMRQIVQQSVDHHLAPAQRRFLSLLAMP